MKTPINLSDYALSGKNNPAFQIADSKVNGLARVLEINRAEYLFDVDMIAIHATTYYIDPAKKAVIYSEPTKVEGKDWNILKGDLTTKIDENFQPVANPDFDNTKPIDRETNYPYILTDAYLQFKAASIALNMPMLSLFIAMNDGNNLFD